MLLNGLDIMNLKLIKKSLFVFLVIFSILSCNNVEKGIKSSRNDTIELLNLSLGGKEFSKLWLESYFTNQSTIFIALDSSGNLWPKKAGNVPLNVITDFDKQQDFLQIAKETRFVVNPPEFKFYKDSAQVKVFSFTFNLESEFIFVKKDNMWILVDHHEYQL